MIDEYPLVKMHPHAMGVYVDEENYELRSEYVWDKTIKALLGKKELGAIKLIEFARQHDEEYAKTYNNMLKQI